MMNISDSILLVDDDTDLNRLVQEFLISNGFSVVVETHGGHAADQIIRLKPILVILDIMLPGLDGLSICRSIRSSFTGPIMILTALADDIDQVAGLETGADAYLAKPVKPRVLLAHIRALLRRSMTRLAPVDSENPSAVTNEHSGSEYSPDLLEVGRLKISASRRTVLLDQEPLEITSGEFDVLWILANHAGEIVSRDTLHQYVRGMEYDGLDRTVDQHISKIRRKIGDDAKSAAIIKSVRGVGYILTA